jgi:hypothetical protein
VIEVYIVEKRFYLNNVHMHFRLTQFVHESNTLRWCLKDTNMTTVFIDTDIDLSHSELSAHVDAKHVIVSCMGRCL